MHFTLISTLCCEGDVVSLIAVLAHLACLNLDQTCFDVFVVQWSNKFVY